MRSGSAARPSRSVADAIVRNNMIAGSDVGIPAAPHQQVPQVRGVTIVNNTIYGHRSASTCAGEGARDMVLANNAVYCPGAGASMPRGLDGPAVRIRANLVEGALTGRRSTAWVLAGGARPPGLPGPGGLGLLAAARGAPDRRRGAGAGAGDGLQRRPAGRRAYDVGAYQSGGKADEPGLEDRAGIQGAMSGPSRLSVLAVTSLFPSNVDPTYAPFNRLQFGALAKLADVSVVGVVPWRYGRWYAGVEPGVVREEIVDSCASPSALSLDPGLPSLNAGPNGVAPCFRTSPPGAPDPARRAPRLLRLSGTR